MRHQVPGRVAVSDVPDEGGGVLVRELEEQAEDCFGEVWGGGGGGEAEEVGGEGVGFAEGVVAFGEGGEEGGLHGFLDGGGGDGEDAAEEGKEGG